MNQSDSIFSGTPQNNDVRHDLDTVQEQWSREKKRRIKRALVRVVLPIALLIIYSIFAAKNSSLPGHSLFAMHPFSYGGGCCGGHDEEEDDHDHDSEGDHDHDHGKHGHKHKKPQGQPQPPGTIGFPEAKVHISLVPELASKSLVDLVMRAVEAKPSEIFVTTITRDKLTPEQLKQMQNNESCGLTINGKSEFDIIDTNGVKKKLQLNAPFTIAYTGDDLAIAIMDVHAQQYGKPNVPVFLPVSAEAEAQIAKRDEKLAQKHAHGDHDDDHEEEQPKQTFDNLPTIREAP